MPASPSRTIIHIRWVSLSALAFQSPREYCLREHWTSRRPIRGPLSSSPRRSSANRKKFESALPRGGHMARIWLIASMRAPAHRAERAKRYYPGDELPPLLYMPLLTGGRDKPHHLIIIPRGRGASRCCRKKKAPPHSRRFQALSTTASNRGGDVSPRFFTDAAFIDHRWTRTGDARLALEEDATVNYSLD